MGDFWVAAANAVVKETSINRALDLPFFSGRVDKNQAAGECADSSGRLPADDGCTAVEGVLINRMGLTWTDAVALLGAHTLGRGHAEFSGHAGTWVDNNAESVIFDKRYYTEIFNRAWFPRNTTNPAGDQIQNWNWGGAQLTVMMLNADMCLAFDIPDPQIIPGSTPQCCTDISGNCRNTFANTQCGVSTVGGGEARAAVDLFAAGARGDNALFYDAFTTAWSLATENGYAAGTLSPLQSTCGSTSAPVASPTSSPVVTAAPPTSSPVVTAAPPTSSPVVSAVCEDVESFVDNKGKTKTCAHVIAKGSCTKWGHLCRVSCGVCNCLTDRMRCQQNSDCCINICRADGTCKP